MELTPENIDIEASQEGLLVLDETPAQPKVAVETPIEIAKPATTENLLGIKLDNSRQGCQCEKCLSDSNPQKDKRGRHHKACNCALCSTKKQSDTITQEDVVNPFYGENEIPNSQEELPIQDEQATQPAQPEKNFDGIANLTFDVSVNSLSALFGPEWQPHAPEEKAQVVGAIANYYKSRDLADIPPGMLLAIVVIAYSASRVTKPATKNKLHLAWSWLKVKGSKLFKRKNNLGTFPVIQPKVNND